jgi:LDH2 family malate/lactate/ureidoglycolate dehydrogenase
VTASLTTPNVSARELRDAVEWLLEGSGLAASNAEIVAEAIVAANLRGVDSHGVGLVPRYVRGLAAGALNADPSFERLLDAQAVALIDADGGPGHLAAHHGMREAIERAREFGVGLVLVRNTNHFGMAANYAAMAAREGMFALATTNGPPVMAPYGGVKLSLCNNPLAVAVPRGDEPVILDMALSTVARGKIRDAELRGVAIPEGWARDAHGRPTTDPAEALKGSLEWVGGYKGYGLGLVIEILAGVLSGSRFGTQVSDASTKAATFAPAVPLLHGHAFLAIDVNRFAEPEAFAARLEELARMMGDAGREGGDPVLLPGDRERDVQATRLADGIPLPPALLAELRALAGEVQHGRERPAFLKGGE